MTSQESLAARMKPVTALLEDAIPEALQQVKDSAQYSEPLRPLNAVRLAADFRYEMRLILGAHPSLFSNLKDCDVDVTPRNIGNLGLQFNFDGIEAKILKGSDGQLPTATRDSQVDFYTQSELPLGDYTKPDETPRVIYLWECDSIESRGRAWLIRPKSATLYSKHVEVHWSEELNLRVKRTAPRKPQPPARTDLPIGLPTEDVDLGPPD